MSISVKSIPADLKNRIRKIRMLLFDVDGVLTEGGIILGTEGQELKIFNVQDGMGITLARMGGLKVGIITGRKSEAVATRAKELHFDVLYQGEEDKLTAYKRIMESYDLDDKEICYMGDDLLDLRILKKAGVAASPANARDEVQKVSEIVTMASGGRGAVRELVELVLRIQGKWDKLLKQLS